MSYADFLQKNIFRPLVIQPASVFKINQPIPNRVAGYEPAKDGKFIKSDAEESVFFSREADGGIYNVFE